jgi:membrane fusion protein, copper/silver efflux system
MKNSKFKSQIAKCKMKKIKLRMKSNFHFALFTLHFAIVLGCILFLFASRSSAQEHAGHGPVTQGTATAKQAQTPPAAEPETAAPTITISEEKRQLIGVRIAAAEFRSLDKQVRTVGKVEVDETRLAFVNTKIAGWVKKLFVNFTGDQVVKGQPLLSIYSPDLVTAQEEYLLALHSRTTVTGGDAPEIEASQQSLIDSAKRRLLLWDITREQIATIEKTGKTQTEMTINAPLSGIVLEKMVLDGAYMMPGTNLYKIADLSTVWIIADVYEYEVPLVKIGQQARVTLPYSSGEVLHATVSFINPVLDPMTRTVKVRIAVKNPGLVLKPDMFVNVEIMTSSGSRLVIPRSAVLDSGTRQIVYVEKETGVFEMRSVTLGLRGESDVEVLKGIKKGEHVVTSGNFLIDSESQLQMGQ